MGREKIILVLLTFSLFWGYVAAQEAVPVMISVLDTATQDCIGCHGDNTPGIVADYLNSKMAGAGVGCLDCHKGMSGDPSIMEHNGYEITAVVSPRVCGQCHPENVEQYSKSKHAWTAFIGPYKPWYQAMLKEGKDPLSQATAKESNPRDFIKSLVTPLYPDSGILDKVGILAQEDYNHQNQITGCAECHGSYVIAENGEVLDGWPNVGVGRVNPDGSLGSCSACHTRHLFSRAEARQPETCGQCHLGPDHPQAEIYEESKHGNMFNSLEDKSFLEEDELTPENIRAPTCAVCHMSAFNGAPATHEAGARLYWELQPARSVPQWKNPTEVGEGKDFINDRIPDEAQAKENRKTMKMVCRGCHSPNWVNDYFDQFDNVVSDYNMVWDYTDGLLQDAYDEGLISKDNPIDEVPESMHYYIWHHDGRRWRMGAAMMGPDWVHWNGAVDACLDKLTMMVSWIENARKIKELETQAMKAEEEPAAQQGICGPTAMVGLALLPLVGYRLRKRR